MAKVELLGFGHALIEGDRGARGGKPSKDSVWGFALVDNKLVTFGGRRGGVLRYKAFPKDALELVQAQWQVKQEGSDKGFGYTVIESDEARETLVPNLIETIGKGYYKAVFDKKVNNRATKPQAPKYKAPNPKKVFAFPTQASVAHVAAEAAKAAAQAAKVTA
jgi:hypothetical protein